MSVYSSLMVNYTRFTWNVAVIKYEKYSPADVILAYEDIQHWKIALLVGSVKVLNGFEWMKILPL